MRGNVMNIDRRNVLKSAGAIGATAALAGCTGGDSEEGFTDITALGGITGGSGYQHCLAFQQVIEENLDEIRVTVSGTDGWGWNASNMYDSGADQMGIVPAGHAYDITHGLGDYEEERNYLAQIYPAHPPTYLHGIALEEKGIETFNDLEGQRVNILPRGSQTEQLIPQVLDALDVEAEFMHLPHDEAASALQQDDIDVATASGVASPYMEVSQTEDVQVITLEDGQQEAVNEVMAWMGFASPDFSELGYSGTGEALVPAPWTIMAGLLDLDDDLVYDLLDTMWSNVDQYTAIYDAAEGIAPEMSVDANIPLHPGAVDYYDEAGVDIPENLRIDSVDDLPLEE